MTTGNTDSSLKQKVIATLASTFRVPADAIAHTSRLGEPPAWDSMGHMELIVSLERDFGVSFPSYRLPELISVAEIVAALRELGVDSAAG